MGDTRLSIILTLLAVAAAQMVTTQEYLDPGEAEREACAPWHQLQEFVAANQNLSEEISVLRAENQKLRSQLAELHKKSHEAGEAGEILDDLNICLEKLNEAAELSDARVEELEALNIRLDVCLEENVDINNTAIEASENYEACSSELEALKKENHNFSEILDERNLENKILINNFDSCSKDLRKSLHLSIQSSNKVELMNDTLHRYLNEKQDLIANNRKLSDDNLSCNKNLTEVKKQNYKFQVLYNETNLKYNSLKNEATQNKNLIQKFDYDLQFCMRSNLELELEKEQLIQQNNGSKKQLEYYVRVNNGTIKTFHKMFSKVRASSENIEPELASVFDLLMGDGSESCRSELNSCKEDLSTLRNSSSKMQEKNDLISKLKIQLYNCSNIIEIYKIENRNLHNNNSVMYHRHAQLLEKMVGLTRQMNNKNKIIFEIKQLLVRMHRTHEIFNEKEQFNESLRILILILKAERLIYGPEKKEIMLTMQEVARVLCAMERYDDALIYAQNATEKSRLIFGENGVQTLKLVSELAEIQIRRGALNEALVCLADLLGKQKVVLGEDHEDTRRTAQRIDYVNKLNKVDADRNRTRV